MGHALLKKAILLLKMANVPFDLLIAVLGFIVDCGKLSLGGALSSKSLKIEQKR